MTRTGEDDGGTFKNIANFGAVGIVRQQQTLWLQLKGEVDETILMGGGSVSSRCTIAFSLRLVRHCLENPACSVSASASGKGEQREGPK